MNSKMIDGKYSDVLDGPDGREIVLGTFASMDRSDQFYCFDELRVYQLEDSRLFYGKDSGCSCPTPFENVTLLSHLTPITCSPDSLMAFERDVLGWVVDSEGVSKEACLVVIDQVRKHLKQASVAGK